MTVENVERSTHDILDTKADPRPHNSLILGH